MRTLFTAACSLALLAAASADEWHGTWTNKRTRSSGKLHCVTNADGQGKWKATFSGSFEGRPFKYRVSFRSSGSGDAVAGTALISNRRYRWEGTLSPEKLTGRYRADNGYFGDFELHKE
jgi:hypothetical protein